MLAISRFLLFDFIDGTVEGTSVYYPDIYIEHDHTYYGNGCPNVWDGSKPDEGYGGSDKACETRVQKTNDDEDLEIGTYYNLQAASSGSGAPITTENANIPDSFCPLGWQLPYGGTGGDYYDKSKSWIYLLSAYNFTGSMAGSNGFRSYPLSYLYTGLYVATVGRLFNQRIYGYYWTSTITGGNSGRTQRVWNVNLQQSSESKSSTTPFRCNFIDGTVASVYVHGDDEKSLVQYAHDNELLDGSYFGMGCPNGWGPEGMDGSDIPCTATGRIVKDGDDEDQKNGTYYNYQAATVGAGGAMTTINTNSPDTFCPLGWQLPYGGTDGEYYDKSRSYLFLYTTYNIAINNGDAQSARKIIQYPFSNIYGGYSYWKTGRLYEQNNFAILWTSTNAYGPTSAYWFVVGKTQDYVGSIQKQRGNNIRCDCGISILNQVANSIILKI